MEREKAMERAKEAACRADFMTNPGHAAECVCSPACGRDYDTMPYPEAEPFPESWYVGTGIGALYWGPMAPVYALELAGWNVGPFGTEHENDELLAWIVGES